MQKITFTVMVSWLSAIRNLQMFQLSLKLEDGSVLGDPNSIRGDFTVKTMMKNYQKAQLLLNRRSEEFMVTTCRMYYLPLCFFNN